MTYDILNIIDSIANHKVQYQCEVVDSSTVQLAILDSQILPGVTYRATVVVVNDFDGNALNCDISLHDNTIQLTDAVTNEITLCYLKEITKAVTKILAK